MRVPFFRSLILTAALVPLLVAQADESPMARKRKLPARQGPDALSGHDRADLRRDYTLWWFGGKASPEYLDFKNRVAERERQRWSHLLPGAVPLAAQASAASAPSWVNLGPTANLTNSTFPDIDSGRPVAMVAHPTQNTLYLATSGGGVFRCDNADPASTSDWTWTSITDSLPTSGSEGNVSIGAMAMSPGSSSTLYLGAGDAHDAEGRGFYRSTDGGASWTGATGIGNATRSYAILPLSASVIFWGTNDGLKKSTDGGATFTPVGTAGLSAGRVWSVQKVTATDLIASVESGSSGTGTGTLYYSSNGGTTWSLATMTGVPVPVGRITVAAGGNGATAYAILEDTTTSSSTTVARGVLQTSDKGVNWTWLAAPTVSGGLFQGTGPQMSSDSGQGWYNHGLAVDPNNADRLFVASNLALYRSLDGGGTWAQMTHWYGNQHVYAHADFHASAWNAAGTVLYLANDGGLCIVRDPFRATIPTGTSSVASDPTFIDNRRNKGLASHMAYSVGSTTATTPADSKYRISLGLQDNGTRVRQPATAGASLTGTEGVFEDGIGGDGFGTLFHPANGNLVLGSLYYTRVYKSTDGGSSFSASSTGITESNNNSSAPFFTFLAPGPTATPDVVYTYVNTKVYQSTDFGGTWNALGTGGALGTATSLVIRGVGAAAGDPNAVGVVANSGRVFLTYNGGSTWSAPATLTNNNYSLSSIAFDPTNSQVVYVASVALGSYNHLWKSTNGGTSWTPVDGSATTSNGFPYGIPVHVVRTDPRVANKVWAGTDLGVYVSADGGSTWSRFGSGLPLVATRDLYLAPNGSFLRAATFGRGVWECNLSSGSVSLDVNADGTVDLRDLLFLAKNYATSNTACDLNSDGTVNDADLTLLLAGL